MTFLHQPSAALEALTLSLGTLLWLPAQACCLLGKGKADIMHRERVTKKRLRRKGRRLGNLSPFPELVEWPQMVLHTHFLLGWHLLSHLHCLRLVNPVPGKLGPWCTEEQDVIGASWKQCIRGSPEVEVSCISALFSFSGEDTWLCPTLLFHP